MKILTNKEYNLLIEKSNIISSVAINHFNYRELSILRKYHKSWLIAIDEKMKEIAKSLGQRTDPQKGSYP